MKGSQQKMSRALAAGVGVTLTLGLVFWAYNLGKTQGAASRPQERAWSGQGASRCHVQQFEGVDGPAGVALIGDEAALDAGLGRLGDAGATDYLAQIMADDSASAARTFDYLASRCAS